MGALGSGRHRDPNAKQTTAGVPALDIRTLKRQEALESGQQFEWQWFRRQQEIARVLITSVQDGLRVSPELPEVSATTDPTFITLEWTACRLGGERPWFICPECGRRCALLYLNQHLSCRECHQLVYACQRETDYARLVRRTNNLRRRLGWEPGILNDDGTKPEGMHWKNYYRLMHQQQHYQLQALTVLGSRIQSLYGSLSKAA
ncbi:MAG: hypothetical protein SVU24_07640 [Pseudomonadota bacterium]|nr:hypothetical protein [Pseudomonadota bacterium]